MTDIAGRLAAALADRYRNSRVEVERLTENGK